MVPVNTSDQINNDDGYEVEPSAKPDSGDGQEDPTEDAKQDLSDQDIESVEGEPASSSDGGHDLEPLDEPAAPEPACPHCGAPTHGKKGPCLRCGQSADDSSAEVTSAADHFTERSAASVVADAVGAFERDADELDKPISGTGRGGFLFPGALALLCVAITVGGYFAGIHALFPGVDDPELTVSVGWRFLGLLRYVALVVFLVGCGLVALAVIAVLLTVAFGDVPLATIRLLSCVTAMRLVAFISIPATFLEVLVELIVGVAVVLILMMLFFSIKLREACLFIGMTVLCVFLIWITAYFVIWVMAG